MLKNIKRCSRIDMHKTFKIKMHYFNDQFNLSLLAEVCNTKVFFFWSCFCHLVGKVVRNVPYWKRVEKPWFVKLYICKPACTFPLINQNKGGAGEWKGTLWTWINLRINQLVTEVVKRKIEKSDHKPGNRIFNVWNWGRCLVDISLTWLVRGNLLNGMSFNSQLSHWATHSSLAIQVVMAAVHAYKIFKQF